ncbi:hypothetical protein [Shewanella frigidimarina]|jgi:hypothetical protein|uniref:hypothetical protein n=1 Tax=Shewanella frigidimarina TaxID=56812 RepID=UPI003D7A114A
MNLERDILNIGENIENLKVSNLAFRYIQLEFAYRQVCELWFTDALEYQIVESLYHLSSLARRERVHPVYANMTVSEWTRAPAHTQTLCWLNQLKSSLRKARAAHQN